MVKITGVDGQWRTIGRNGSDGACKLCGIVVDRHIQLLPKGTRWQGAQLSTDHYPTDQRLWIVCEDCLRREGWVW